MASWVPLAFIEGGGGWASMGGGGGRTINFAGEFKPHIQCTI